MLHIWMLKLKAEMFGENECLFIIYSIQFNSKFISFSTEGIQDIMLT